MAKEPKEIYEFEFDGKMFNNFNELIGYWKDVRWGKSDKEAKTRMLYWYKKDQLKLDPKMTKVVFEGTIRPTGRHKVVWD